MSFKYLLPGCTVHAIAHAVRITTSTNQYRNSSRRSSEYLGAVADFTEEEAQRQKVTELLRHGTLSDP